MSQSITHIVLCGGSGTRLWPISRTLQPKQFLKLFDHESLFQKTIQRNQAISHKQIIVLNQEQYFLALDELADIQSKNTEFILEPIAKNTAPAILLACLHSQPNDILLVTPADHLIQNQSKYEEATKQAIHFAEQDKLVTFGIQPSRAETGYGYIQYQDNEVTQFIEKPNATKAQQYFQEKNYLWNSGMFCFKAQALLNEAKKHAPQILEACIQTYKQSKKFQNTLKLNRELMRNIPADSIDYAIMEKSQSIKVIPCDIGWNDVGSFESLHEELEKDSTQINLNTHILNVNSQNSLVLSHKTTALIDIDDLMIIDTDDALLVAKKGSGQKVKEIYQMLSKQGAELQDVHTTAYRPWGTYQVLEAQEGYKIKKIVVKPHKRLSLQMHHHRNEHWIVIQGTAKVTVGEEEKLIYTNESTYIKKEQKHRLENPMNEDLIIIEAQVGNYTGEDDIIRFDDDFKRDQS